MTTLSVVPEHPAGLPWRALALLGIGYLGCAFAGSHLSSPALPFVHFWLPNGLLVAMLLRHPTRHWPVLLATGLLANLGFELLAGHPLHTGFFFIIANGLEALIGAWLVRRLVASQPQLTTAREVVGLVLYSAVISTMIAATVGTLSLAVTAGTSVSGLIWMYWWGGDALGILLMAPLVLVWQQRPDWKWHRSHAARVAELTLVCIVLGVTLYFCFTPGLPTYGAVQYVAIACVLWVAIRADLHFSVAVGLVAALLAAWLIKHGNGQADDPATMSFASMQLFFAVMAATGLVIAVLAHERRTTEHALRDHERRMVAAERIAQTGNWTFELATRRIIWSEGMWPIYGLVSQPDGFDYETLIAMVHPDDRAKHDEYAAGFHRLSPDSPTVPRMEYRVLRPDGSERTVEVYGNPEFDHLGRPSRVFGIVRDITELKLAAEALSRSEEKYAATFRHAPVWIVISDASDSTILEVNERALQASGYTRDEVVGRTGAELGWINGEDRARLLQQLKLNGWVDGFEMNFHARDGRRLCGLVSGGMIVIGGRNCTLTVTIDITERKQALAKLESSHLHLRNIIQGMPVMVDAFDERGVLAMWNAECERVTGYLADEVVGNPEFMNLMYPDPEYRERMLQEWSKRGDDYRDWEWDIVCKDGRKRTIAWSNVSKKLPIPGWSTWGIGVDVSNRLQLEATLRQSQKLEAVGTLAGGIAHDFNNILAGIYGYLNLARTAAGDNIEVLAHLDEIGRAGHRAAELVKQILSFSRAGDLALAPLQLNEVVTEAVNLLRATLPSTIEIHTGLPEDLPPVMANAVQIHQVVMNLGTNAAHAMRDRPGQLRIALDRCVVDEAMTRTMPDLAPGLCIRLIVSDTGTGMDADLQTRIFEPFFSTKGPGGGSGLGLSVVHGIVRNHRGAIRLTSRTGQGTTFEIFLPASASTPQRAKQETGQVVRGQGECILLVDDEVTLLKAVEFTLQNLGYTTVSENRPEEALARVATNPQAFQLVITDQTMPHMTGLELAARIRDLRPDLPVLIASGYSTALTTERMAAAGVREMIEKPFTMASLAALIRRHLPPATS